MKTTIQILITIISLVCVAYASEEDYAPITKIELTAETPANTFGTVILHAETIQGQYGVGLSTLTVIARGKTMDVPQIALAQLMQATLATTTISSESGYPDKGLGPYLYVCFSGHDGSMSCRFRLIFDSKGFKELKKDRSKQNNSPQSDNKTILTTQSSNLDEEIVESWGPQKEFFVKNNFEIIDWANAEYILLHEEIIGGKQYHTGWLIMYAKNDRQYLVKQPKIDALWEFMAAKGIKLQGFGTE